MQKQQKWPFGKSKNYPYAFSYIPELLPPQQDFLNPYLGYPNCPLIGRYNQGEYRIAQTKSHLQFYCLYVEKEDCYKCGCNKISIPYKMVYNLRNIPEIIKHNKSPGQEKNKKIQDVHPIKFPVRQNLKFTFIITFGQIGKDFLNYLNHMYTLAQDLFIDQKLRRSVFMLPIYAHLPFKSGIAQQEVDKGLCLQNYRSEFLSLHLKWGSPAFSPNNMRLGIEGMKNVASNPPGNKKKKEGKEKNQMSLEAFLYKGQNKQNTQNQKANLQAGLQMSVDIFENSDELFNQEKKKQQNKMKQEQKKQGQKGPQPKAVNKKPQAPNQHKGFVHFYTSVLLQQDYRVYYHWHVENLARREIIQTLLNKSDSLIEFLINCKNLLGPQDQCVMEASKIFGINQ